MEFFHSSVIVVVVVIIVLSLSIIDAPITHLDPNFTLSKMCDTKICECYLERTITKMASICKAVAKHEGGRTFC